MKEINENQTNQQGFFKSSLSVAKRAVSITGKTVGKALDKVGDVAEEICIKRGMSPEDANKVAKRVKIGTAVASTAAGFMVAAPAVIAAVGSAGGYVGAAAMTHGLATLGGGTLAAGGAGMAGGTAVVVGTGAVAAGAAAAVTQKREDEREQRQAEGGQREQK